MSIYTKEFENLRRWVEDQKTKGDILRYSSPDACIAADFWLSAFAKLVRKEAKKTYGPCNDECLGPAFNSICERFGLERK